jgi:hypothetical protein
MPKGNMIFNSGKSVADAPKLKNKRLIFPMKKVKYLKMTSSVTLVAIPAISQFFLDFFVRLICLAKKKLIKMDAIKRKV